LKALPQRLQQVIPRAVAKGIIDMLEIVQVNQQQANQLALRLRILQAGPENLVKGAPVQQPGQLIFFGSLLQPAFGDFLLADVARNEENMLCRAMLIKNRG
jgi:hypothetical protein